MRCMLFILIVISVVGVFATPEKRRYDVKSQRYADALRNEAQSFMTNSLKRDSRPNKKSGIHYHTPPVIAQADLDLINSFENKAKELQRKAGSRN